MFSSAGVSINMLFIWKVYPGTLTRMRAVAGAEKAAFLHHRAAIQNVRFDYAKRWQLLKGMDVAAVNFNQIDLATVQKGQTSCGS